jgi:hypothetical protein
MPPEIALLESRALRDSVLERTHVLDKVKVLAMLPDGLHVTTEMIAAYFEVDAEVIKKLSQRHREELTSNGMRVLRAADLATFKRDNVSLYSGRYPQPRSNLTVYPRRAVLNIAMLLRDSEIARRVRTYLLDVEQESRAQWSASTGSAPWAGAFRGFGLGQEMAYWMHTVEVRLNAHGEAISALNERLCSLGEDMKALRADVGDIKREIVSLRHRRGPHRRH